MSTALNGSPRTTRRPLPGDALIERDVALTQKRWVPGEAGIWALIFTDLGVFTVYFISTMYEWHQHQEMFAAGRESLDLGIGIVNTFFLLTASLFIALSIQYLRQGRHDLTLRMFGAAGLCGSAFIISKAFEWTGKVNDDHTPRTDEFYQLYFVLTGIHLFHVIIAMTLLLFMRRKINQINGTPTLKQTRFLENSAIYWHMVDLIWLVILALFYLMG